MRIRNKKNAANINQYSDERVLSAKGYKITNFLTNTLQGDIRMANDIISSTFNPVVIKRTSKYLHDRKVTIQEGETINVQENIIREAMILKTLNEKNEGRRIRPLIGFRGFFESDSDYYLIMEDGGNSLFAFIQKCHKLIENGLMSTKHWRKQCNFMFAQMVRFQKWMHMQHFCNLDISLENMLISRDCCFDTDQHKLKNCEIKFVDFGLAEYFPSDDFNCTKYVGKRNYKSPKVFDKEIFNACEADIWSLGVCLFAVMAGCFPYKRPCEEDPWFQLIKQQKWDTLIKKMDRYHHFGKHSLNLVQGLLTVDASKRLTMEQICNHKWMLKYHKSLS